MHKTIMIPSMLQYSMLTGRRKCYK